jgi:hypothetical protein
MDVGNNNCNTDKYQNDIENFLEKRKFSHLMKYLLDYLEFLSTTCQDITLNFIYSIFISI